MPDEQNLKNFEFDEYNVLLLVERLESLREELEEVGFDSLKEIEAALALTGSDADGSKNGDVLNQRLAQLDEIRGEMLDLEVDSYQDVNDQIRILHEQLDEGEGDFSLPD